MKKLRIHIFNKLPVADSRDFFRELLSEAATPEVFNKKRCSSELQENACVEVSFFIKVAGHMSTTLLKKRLFSGEFCEIFKNTFLIEHLRVTACVLSAVILFIYIFILSNQKPLNEVFLRIYVSITLTC